MAIPPAKSEHEARDEPRPKLPSHIGDRSKERATLLVPEPQPDPTPTMKDDPEDESDA
jgi:hypothetical protein